MKAMLAALLALAATPLAAQDAEVGAELFYTYCSSCHGEDASGGGPMSEILNNEPPDLTVLSAKNDGVFPRVRVAYRIDGRAPVAGHGGPMPIFGDIFGNQMVALQAESGQPILAGRGIADVMAWLETVQR